MHTSVVLIGLALAPVEMISVQVTMIVLPWWPASVLGHLELPGKLQWDLVPQL